MASFFHLQYKIRNLIPYFETMKKLILFTAVLLFFGFSESEKTVFKSTDGKTKIIATNEWFAAGNMKGVEIFISKMDEQKNTLATLVVSKDENIPENVSLSTYSAGKLFLQTAVLRTTPSFSATKTIKGNPFKYYEYEYSNKDLVKMKTLVYHTLVGSNGYQMVITAPFDGFDIDKPAYMKIGDSLTINP
tara:strand:+ start:109 stop:678 length:570 start_codon:yes stop_codon:yes gene_type:complete